MGRWMTGVLAVAALVAACRPHTVSLAGDPAVGATIRIRYEIDAEVTRSVEGQAPETTVMATQLDTEQEVLAVDGDGSLVALTLRVDGEAPRQARVRLDRAGSLAAIDEVEGLPARDLGLPLAPASMGAPAGLPTYAVAIGDEWAIGEDPYRGRARLTGLGVVDGADVARVRAEVHRDIDESTVVAGQEVALTGRLRSTSTTHFDLGDGSVWRAVSHTTGTVDALVQPPGGVGVLPVPAVITYEVRVRATRMG